MLFLYFQKKQQEKELEEDRPPSRQEGRPKSACSQGSGKLVSKEIARPRSAQLKESQTQTSRSGTAETSRSGTAEAQKLSGNSSPGALRPTSAASQQHAGVSRPTTPSDRQSLRSAGEARSESNQAGCNVSRPGSATSRPGSKGSKRSSRSGSASAELAAIEKKLHEEEKILHDSNLVRGYLDPLKELEERVSSRSLVAS